MFLMDPSRPLLGEVVRFSFWLTVVVCLFAVGGIAFFAYIFPEMYPPNAVRGQILYVTPSLSILICFGVGVPIAYYWQKTNVRVHKQAKELEEANRLLRATTEQRERFVAYVSHELRNPLNVISGILNTENTASLKGEKLKKHRMLKSSSDDLLAIVNDILDLSKVDSGQISLEFDEVELIPFVTDTVDFWEAKAKESGLVIKLMLDEDLPKHVIIDRFRVRQVINNLMSNGIKYTQKGYVQATMSLSEDKSLLMFKTCDTGTGIPSELHKAIFDPYVQVPKQFGVPKKVGTGLGLPIARQMAQMMGGDVILENSNKSGSKFQFSFAYQVAKERSERNNVEKIESIEPQNLRVFVLDDVKSNIFVAEALLKKLKVQCETGTEITTFLKRLEEQEFDVLLLDRELGVDVIDGYIDRIRQLQPKARIVLCTGIDSEHVRKLNIDGMILKPIVFEELRSVIMAGTNR